MLQHARAVLSIAQPRLNGLRIVWHVGPKRQNCRKTTSCARMLKIGFRVRYAFPASNAHHRLLRVIQLRPPPENPARPHAVRIHLQNPDMRTKPIQSRSDPPHDGTDHLARELQNAKLKSGRKPVAVDRAPFVRKRVTACQSGLVLVDDRFVWKTNPMWEVRWSRSPSRTTSTKDPKGASCGC